MARNTSYNDNIVDGRGRPLASPRPRSRADGAEQEALNEARLASMMEDVDFRRDLISQIGFDAGHLMTDSPMSPLARALGASDPFAAYFNPESMSALKDEDQVFMGPALEDDRNVLAHEFRHRGTRELMDHFGLTGKSFDSPEVQSFTENYGLTAYDTLMGDNEFVVELFDNHPDIPLVINPEVDFPRELQTMGDTLDVVSRAELVNKGLTGRFSTEDERIRAAVDPDLREEFEGGIFGKFGKDPTRNLALDDAHQNLNRAAKDMLMDQGRYNPEPGDVRPMSRPYLPADVGAQEEHMRNLLERLDLSNRSTDEDILDYLSRTEGP